MSFAKLSLTTAAIAVVATSAYGGNGNGNWANKPKHNKRPPAHAAPHCPPGLAKKNPPCVPPGLAKKHRYRVGDHIHDGYIILKDPGRYRLDPYQTYYRVGDYLYRVDRETREVLDFIGAAAALLD